jgi:uncharacterized protein (DUF1919 family)
MIAHECSLAILEDQYITFLKHFFRFYLSCELLSERDSSVFF